jgi:hypothetical protein
LYNEAIMQNRRLFEARGLTVLAAPWRYAITTKLDRLMKSGAKSYDLGDAVTYLHEIVVAAGAAMPQEKLGSWAREFKCTVPDDGLIRRLSEAYIEKYKSAGLVVSVVE